MIRSVSALGREMVRLDHMIRAATQQRRKTDAAELDRVRSEVQFTRSVLLRREWYAARQKRCAA